MLDIPWKKILVPNGRDYEYCVKAFERRTGVVVPSFPDRTLAIEKNGRLFIRVKSRDMPELLRADFGDVGLVYTDICEEKITTLNSPLSFDIIDEAHLQFCLLLPEGRYDMLVKRMHNPKLPPITAATVYPAFFEKCLKRLEGKGCGLNVQLSSFTPSGSVEALPALGVSDIVADVVNTGISAQANHLVPVHLADIFPALLYKS